MVSTKSFYNVKDIKEQLFTGVVAAVSRCFTKQLFSNSWQYLHEAPVLEPLFNKHCYKEILTQMFSCKYCKIFKNSFFIEHLRCLLPQVLQKKEVPKNFAISNRMYRYRGPFLSSCRPITCNFVKIEGRYRCFAMNCVKFLRTILCRTNLNGCSWMIKRVAGNRQSRN